MPSAKKKPARKPRKATVRTPVAKLSGKETLEHYNGVVLEEILSHVRTMSEGYATIEQKLDTKIESLRTDMNEQFRIVHAVLKIHTEDIKELKTDVAGIKSDMSTMESRLTARIDRIGVRQDDHEGRITALETAHAPHQ